MTTHVEARAARRERALRFVALRRAGLTLQQIAEREGVSRQRVQRIITEFFPEPLPPPDPPPSPRSLDRPEWSRPSPRLLDLARSIRDEIAAVEGFERPRL